MTYEELKHALLGKVYEVYDVFKNFFNEENVDLQNVPSDEIILNKLSQRLNILSSDGIISDFDISPGEITDIKDSLHSPNAYPFILVYWPRVVVTNENNRSIVIDKLFAKVEITLEGTIPYECRGFSLNRAHYNKLQFTNNYMHSHIPHIPKTDFTQFQNPCLGNGPICGTIMELKNNYNEIEWMLFCQELSMYVTVESLTGGPYYRMENLSDSKERELSGCYYRENTEISLYEFKALQRQLGKEGIEDFLVYYLQNGHLQFNFINNSFGPGKSFIDFLIDISNCFIDFYNNNFKTALAQAGVNSQNIIRTLYQQKVLYTVHIVNNKVYTLCDDSHGSVDPNLYRGSHVCKFKGEWVNLSLDWEEESGETSMSTILSPNICLIFLKHILKVLNYRYDKNNGRNNTAVEESSARTHQNVCYL